jgi:hypothetical protein
MLDALSLAPWDSDKARTWWLEHQPALDRQVARAIGEARTIAVDARARPAPEVEP